MAEMYGKHEGCSRGRGGSMHLFDARRRASMAATRSSAAACRSRSGWRSPTRCSGAPRVTACFFGEGAVAEGEFHESLNLAALWKLPVLFLCENNLYAMGTALERSESETDLVEKAQSYKMPAEAVDGMDVVAVEAAAAASRDAVRRGEGPLSRVPHLPLPRALDVRPRALSRQGRGRGLEAARDPIATFTARLKERGVATDALVAASTTSVAEEIAEAVAFAEAGTWEPVEDLLKHVYTPAARRHDREPRDDDHLPRGDARGAAGSAREATRASS